MPAPDVTTDQPTSWLKYNHRRLKDAELYFFFNEGEGSVATRMRLAGEGEAQLWDGETGRIVSDEGFAAAVAEVLADPVKHAQMREAARAYACTASWDSVFEGLYDTYETILPRQAVCSF